MVLNFECWNILLFSMYCKMLDNKVKFCGPMASRWFFLNIHSFHKNYVQYINYKVCLRHYAVNASKDVSSSRG
jgi:hypothetical protein